MPGKWLTYSYILVVWELTEATISNIEFNTEINHEMDLSGQLRKAGLACTCKTSVFSFDMASSHRAKERISNMKILLKA